MEKSAKWLCDCGKTYVQPVGNVKFPIREVCECGKTLYKLQEPDGIVTEFVDAEDWFIKEFDEQNKKLNKLGSEIAKWSGIYFSAMETVNGYRERIKEAKKRMDTIVDLAVPRHRDHSNTKLSRRRDMHWNFNRMIGKWLGHKKPEVKHDK